MNYSLQVRGQNSVTYLRLKLIVRTQQHKRKCTYNRLFIAGQLAALKLCLMFLTDDSVGIQSSSRFQIPALAKP